MLISDQKIICWDLSSMCCYLHSIPLWDILALSDHLHQLSLRQYDYQGDMFISNEIFNGWDFPSM